MDITIKAVGTKPLLLHNVDLANPLNPYSRQMADLRGTPSKRRTEKWHEEMSKAQFLGAFYEGDPISIPAENLRRSIISAAKVSRMGTAVLRALTVVEPSVPIIFDGPRSRDGLWQAGWHLTRMIRGTGGASPTTWPKFEGWAIRVPFDLDETVLNMRDLQDLVARAGRIEGLGASRKQGYGRYDGLAEAA